MPFSDLIESMEPALSFARDALRSPGRLHEAHEALAACRTYLELHRTPAYRNYDPAQLLDSRAAELVDDAHVLETEPTCECLGDPEQVFECVKTLVRAAQLEPESALVIKVLTEKEIPQITLTLDGPGRFPDPAPIGRFLDIPLAALNERWTAATRGGRMDRIPNGFALRLKGLRTLPEPVKDADTLLAHLRKSDLGEVEALLRKADGVNSDGPGTKDPGDVAAVLAQVVHEYREELAASAITLETLCEPDVPPVAMVRKRVASFFANAIRCSLRLERGGSITIWVGYDRHLRQVPIEIGIVRATSGAEEIVFRASLQRAIVDVHGGTFTVQPHPDAVTISAAIPDPVGKTLDEWIPGFETFSPRSKQMLRLLKSGRQAPPEEFLLAGILETELEEWLLPFLSQPVAANLAHKLVPDNGALPRSSPERLAKALTQIRRGKPRKEVLKPAYAAEILWAFRLDERHRTAAGAGRLEQAAVERLCVALLAQPPRYVDCLRIVAQARAF